MIPYSYYVIEQEYVNFVLILQGMTFFAGDSLNPKPKSEKRLLFYLKSSFRS